MGGGERPEKIQNDSSKVAMRLAVRHSGLGTGFSGRGLQFRLYLYHRILPAWLGDLEKMSKTLDKTDKKIIIFLTKNTRPVCFWLLTKKNPWGINPTENRTNVEMPRMPWQT